MSAPEKSKPVSAELRNRLADMMQTHINGDDPFFIFTGEEAAQLRDWLRSPAQEALHAHKELRDVLHQCREWLYAAYRDVDSLAGQQVRAALPNIDQHLQALAGGPIGHPPRPPLKIDEEWVRNAARREAEWGDLDCSVGPPLSWSITLKRAFELGAIAMRQTCAANCGNATESLQEGVMTDASLTKADKKAMMHQVDAINAIEKEIHAETPDQAAYYGSYILQEPEKSQIRLLYPQYPATRPPRSQEEADDRR